MRLIKKIMRSEEQIREGKLVKADTSDSAEDIDDLLMR